MATILTEQELVSFLNIGEFVKREECITISASDVGSTKTFDLDNVNVVPNTLVLYYGTNPTALTVIPSSDYTVDYEKGEVTLTNITSAMQDNKIYASYIYVHFKSNILTNAVNVAHEMVEKIAKTSFSATPVSRTEIKDVNIQGNYVDLYTDYVEVQSINSVERLVRDSWETLSESTVQGYQIIDSKNGVIRIYGYYGSQTFKINYTYSSTANNIHKQLAIYLALDFLISNPIYGGSLLKGFAGYDTIDLGAVRSEIEKLSKVVGRWS